MTTPVSCLFVTINIISCFTYLPDYCRRVLRLWTPLQFPKHMTILRFFVITYSTCLKTCKVNLPTIPGLMAHHPRTLEAACLCGAALHEIALKEAAIPIQAAFCHCTSSRQMSGCLFLTKIPFETDNTYTPSPSLLNKLTPFEHLNDRIHHYLC